MGGLDRGGKDFTGLSPKKGKQVARSCHLSQVGTGRRWVSVLGYPEDLVTSLCVPRMRLVCVSPSSSPLG